VGELWSLFNRDDLFSELTHLLPLENLAASGDERALGSLLAASFSHHGRPFDPFGEGETKRRYSTNRYWEPSAEGYDPFLAIAEIGSAVTRWFPEAFAPRGTPLPNGTRFQHAFAGLVMLADWIGSDTRFFPFSNEGDGDRLEFARTQASHALASIGLDVESKRVYVRGHRAQFTDMFPAIPAPNPMQEGACRSDTGRLVILEAETGSGKTEAALWRFKQLFEAGLVDGLYFALPTRIAATHIHARVYGAVQALFANEDRPAVVMAVPGYVRVDDAGGRILPGFDVLWTDSPEEAEAHKRWAAENPKRYLAAQIAVGTIDQALLSNLAVRHAHLRSTALLRHLLVVDEVHASNVYMTDLLASVLAVHVGAGGHALLMSATLGATSRRQYLLGRHAPQPSPQEAMAVPYPCLSWADDSGERVAPLAAAGRRKVLSIQTAADIDVPDAIARRALEAARIGAKVLVVRNTVGGAVAVQRALEETVAADSNDAALLFRCEGVATLHHGRFARDDRVLLDRAVEARIGRERPAGGVVVVGTQTLEQSLDIDADLLITDLCPMDVLLQRIGRLHRHDRRDRPSGFTEARCVVLTFPDRDLTPLLTRSRHGLGPMRDFCGVYPDVRILEATWRLIDAHAVLDIPTMNRMLVEGATHPSALDAVSAKPGDALSAKRKEMWTAHANGLSGKCSADRSIAGMVAIDRNQPFEKTTLHSAEEHIQTRLGADSRVIDFGAVGEPLPTGPFIQPVRLLTLPEHMCRGIPADAGVTIREQKADGFVFTYGDARFTYGRHGVDRQREE
jgi:CRISPR-associated endonuclease/helicase Cas3